MNISKQDCESIIKRYLQSATFQVLGYKAQPFSELVNGFLGDYFSFKIKFRVGAEDRKVSFFAKRFPIQHEVQHYVLAIKAFTKEILTYEELFEKFKQINGFSTEFAPNYYFGKDNEIIVLEDISAKGFVLPQHPNRLSIGHLKLSLSVLAKFHAGSIGYQEIKSKELGRKFKLTDEYSQYMQEPLFRKDNSFLGYNWCKARLTSLIGIIDLLPATENISKAAFKKKVSNLAEQSFEILKSDENHYNVICHGDMWAKNVMFRYENGVPVECKLIDFQLLRYCPPAYDVLQFIYLTTSTDTRKHHLNKLLRHYHECLREELQNGNLNLDDIIPYEDFEKSVHYLLPQIKLHAAYYHSFQGANPDFLKRIITSENDFNTFIFEDGAPLSIELFKSDQNYKTLMIEALEEIKYL